MSDLVERLRDTARTRSERTGNLMREAADEIERLRGFVENQHRTILNLRTGRAS